MSDNSYTNFVQFLDNYATHESIINGEYEILRKSIRNNYVKMNMDNLSNIKGDYEIVNTNPSIESFLSFQPVSKRPSVEIVNQINNTDISLNTTNNIVKKTKEETIDIEINNIGDLIDVLNVYEYQEDTEYNIDLESLHKIKSELVLLNEMVGLSSLKQSILDQLLYFVQDLHCNEAGGDYKHTVIYGSPGTGKTEIAKIIGTMYSKIGILKKNIFKKITRNDLIAGYLGQTAIKTKQIINDCLGGVLFIDEAYSLANADHSDSFSKECLDILCESLSDHKQDLMVIIAGYEKEMNNTFFKANQGLKSRFIWRFSIDPYTPLELMNMLDIKVKEQGWEFMKNVLNEKWFIKHKEDLKSYGRDIELLFTYMKICHGRRIYGKNKDIRKKITIDDLNSGFKMLLANKEKKEKTFMSTLYV
jgi:SpoVK/Ycf46/Vps4 family AAA+-type ATPase|tara:strand:+ start:4174 stop:5427 length:1254 start_codon:yes stop_codon:yes gene_type:complete